MAQLAQSPARDQVVRGRLPAARRDRRPALAALAVLLILLGALGSALVAFRSGDRVSVLVAARDIPVGSTIDASDFAKVQVAADGQYVLDADRLREVQGTTALVGIPKGTLVSGQMFYTGKTVPAGGELVGVVVDTSQRPSDVPEPGDVVRLYYVAGQNDSSANAQGRVPGTAVVDAARVVHVGSGGGADNRNITVLVRRQDAGDVASLASSSNLAVTVLPANTRPGIDLQGR